jgi:hypothetical protein
VNRRSWAFLKRYFSAEKRRPQKSVLEAEDGMHFANAGFLQRWVSGKGFKRHPFPDDPIPALERRRTNSGLQIQGSDPP